MRINCGSVEDFISNIHSQDVYRKTVYISGDRSPLNGTVRTAISWEVTFQASAVLDFPDGGQALVSCGVACGIDHDEDKDGQDGTKRQKKFKAQLESYCDDYGLMVKPGIVDI